MFQTFPSFFLIQNKHLTKSLNGRKYGSRRSVEKTVSDDTRMFCICKLHTTAVKMSISFKLLFVSKQKYPGKACAFIVS